jgi:hypothetical protein
MLSLSKNWRIDLPVPLFGYIYLLRGYSLFGESISLSTTIDRDGLPILVIIRRHHPSSAPPCSDGSLAVRLAADLITARDVLVLPNTVSRRAHYRLLLGWLCSPSHKPAYIPSHHRAYYLLLLHHASFSHDYTQPLPPTWQTHRQKSQDE